MNLSEAQERLKPLTDEWTSIFGHMLTQFTGAAWKTNSTEKEHSAHLTDDPLLYLLNLNGSVIGDIFLEFDRPEAAGIAATILGETATGTEFTSDREEALLEMLRAAAKALAGALSTQYGEVEANLSVCPGLAAGLIEPSPPWLAADDAGHQIRFKIHFDPRFAEALAVLPPSSAMTKNEGEPNPVANQIDETNFKLVLDVELNVLLRFGQRQLSLREVLDLTSGSVIELDRRVEETVELLLDGKVIARGEAAIVDGNYGLRITEIAQPGSTSQPLDWRN